MTKHKNSNIYFFDAHALCYRAFYAISDLTTSSGMPTGAVLGFINIVKRILKQHDPEHVVFAFDSKGLTKRHRKYKEYKSHRKPMPQELVQQLPYILRYVKAKNFPIYKKSGYEADDIIATLTRQAREKGMEVTIVTGDKDALQLVEPGVTVLSPGTSSDKIYNEQEVERKFGVSPERMLEFMAFVGDASDNIPGVKGIGKVGAARLITEFGSVENVYSSLESISSKSVRQKLEAGREMAILSRKLVELDFDVPVEIDLGRGSGQEEDTEELVKVYTELEFKRLLSKILPTGKKEQGTEYVLVEEMSELEKTLKGFSGGPVAIFPKVDDTGSLMGLAMSGKAFESFYVPFEKGSDLASRLEGFLSCGKTKKIVHDGKKVLGVIRAAGMRLCGLDFDVMLADYISDPGKGEHGLFDMAVRRLNRRLISGGGMVKDLFSKNQELADICGEKSDMIFRLHAELDNELKTKGLTALFYDTEMPLISILADMEDVGIGIDLEYLKQSTQEFGKQLKKLTEEIHNLAEEKFNINSPKQLQHILFEKLGLAPGKKTKTGYSTDESVLAKLSKGHELPRLILKYRHLNKLKTTYYDSIIELTDKKNRVLHTTFNQTVTSTGRLSSSEPNIQNIPIRTEIGRKIRKAFVPPFRSHFLLAADYSQIELRVLAHLSGDNTLTDAFSSGEDVHKFTASRIFDCDIEEVTPEMRRAAKTVNFGIVYGMGKNALAADLEISESEAQEFINAYFERYGSIKEYMENTVRKARTDGYVKTLLNRRRYLPEINSKNPRLRSFAERTAINTPVQGSAADIIKLAMVVCHKKLKNSGTEMIMQVHDELLFSVPEDEQEKVVVLVRDVMESVFDLNVRLKVDLEMGKNWYDMEKVDL